MKALFFRIPKPIALHLLYVLFVFSSCEKEPYQPPIAVEEENQEEPQPDEQEKHELDGKWGLISFECCDLPAEKFEEGQVSWAFDMENLKLRFINEVDFWDRSEYYFKEAGTYDITLEGGKIKILYQGYSTSYKYEVINDNLIISDRPESDGALIKLKKL